MQNKDPLQEQLELQLSLSQDRIKQLENENKLLKKEVELYTKTMEVIPDLIIIIDKDYNLVKTNWKDPILNIGNDIESSQTCYKCLYQKENPCDPCHAGDVFENGYSKTLVSHNFADQQYREITIEPIKNKKGEILYVLEHLHNVTPLKENYELLQKSEAQFRNVVERANDGIWVTNDHAITTFVNARMADILGYQPEDFIGVSVLDFLPKERSQEIESKILKRKQGISEQFDYQFIHKSGDPIHTIVSVSPLLDQKGEYSGTIAIITDITEKKKSEIELIKQKSIAQNYLDVAAVMILSVDYQGKVKMINKKGQQILGYKEKEILGQPYFELCIPKKERDKVLNVFNQLMKGKRTDYKYFENSVITKSGEERLIAWHSTLIKDDKGKVIEILSSGEDITNRKLMEDTFKKTIKELKASERSLKRTNEKLAFTMEKAHESNKLKNEFLRTVSHELRTPLNGILGFTMLLKEETEENLIQEYINYIRMSGERLHIIVEEILDVSRLERGVFTIEKEVFELSPLIQKIAGEAKMEAQEKGLLFQLSVLDEVPSILFTDKTRLTQILNHLLDNAIKNTAKGEIHFSIEVKKNNLYFTVTDTGIGISNKDQRKIFEPFEQIVDENAASASGIGLGLTISRKIAQLLGGEIIMESQLNKGSVFSFVCPIDKLSRKSKEQPIPTYQLESLASDRPYTILLVEDDFTTRFLMNQIFKLKMEHSRVLNASNGEEALEVLQKEQVDVVLMDMRMPIMDGFETTRLIKKEKKWKHIPVIALTAYASEEDKLRCFNVGCNDYLSKPVNDNILLNTVKKWIQDSVNN